MRKLLSTLAFIAITIMFVVAQGTSKNSSSKTTNEYLNGHPNRTLIRHEGDIIYIDEIYVFNDTTSKRTTSTKYLRNDSIKSLYQYINKNITSNLRNLDTIILCRFVINPDSTIGDIHFTQLKEYSYPEGSYLGGQFYNSVSSKEIPQDIKTQEAKESQVKYPKLTSTIKRTPKNLIPSVVVGMLHKENETSIGKTLLSEDRKVIYEIPIVLKPLNKIDTVPYPYIPYELYNKLNIEGKERLEHLKSIITGHPNRTVIRHEADIIYTDELYVFNDNSSSRTVSTQILRNDSIKSLYKYINDQITPVLRNIDTTILCRFVINSDTTIGDIHFTQLKKYTYSNDRAISSIEYPKDIKKEEIKTSQIEYPELSAIIKNIPKHLIPSNVTTILQKENETSEGKTLQSNQRKVIYEIPIALVPTKKIDSNSYPFVPYELTIGINEEKKIRLENLHAFEGYPNRALIRYEGDIITVNQSCVFTDNTTSYSKSTTQYLSNNSVKLLYLYINDHISTNLRELDTVLLCRFIVKPDMSIEDVIFTQWKTYPEDFKYPQDIKQTEVLASETQYPELYSIIKNLPGKLIPPHVTKVINEPNEKVKGKTLLSEERKVMYEIPIVLRPKEKIDSTFYTYMPYELTLTMSDERKTELNYFENIANFDSIIIPYDKGKLLPDRPFFKDGEVKFNKKITDAIDLNYDGPLIHFARFEMQFTITTKGKAKDITIIRSDNKKMGNIIKNVIKNSKWKTGKYKNIPLNCEFIYTIEIKQRRTWW